MRTYLRMRAPGARFFLTLVTFGRRPILTSLFAELRRAMRCVHRRHAFRLWGFVVLPDHLHTLIELPDRDDDFSTRIMLFKSAFSRSVAPDALADQPSNSRRRRRERTVWQRRFWEHTIRDERDFASHMDYIHYNPVRHARAACPHAWPFSTFSAWVRRNRYPADWACSCHGAARPPSSIDGMGRSVGE